MHPASCQDWVGIFKGRAREKCPRCGGWILPESYVGVEPSGALYCKQCVSDELLRLQAQENEKKSAAASSSGLYI